MSKIMIMVGVFLVLAGCDNTTGTSKIYSDAISTRCLNGIEYYLFQERQRAGYKGYGYMAVKYKPDGTVSTCYRSIDK